MIERRTVLALITARGGSQSIPRKNLAMLAGKPLIAWTIEEALKSRLIDRLILSSDDEEIMAVSARYGCDVPFRRPAELARHDTPSMPVIKHAIDQVPGYDIIMLLQPTSPCRSVDDIDACLQTASRSPQFTSFTVHPVGKVHYMTYRLDEASGTVRSVMDLGFRVQRRQDMPPLYVQNGSVYCADTAFYMEHGDFRVADTRVTPVPAWRGVDVDDHDDLVMCEALLRAHGRA